MRLVLIGVQVTESVDASITFVQPAFPWIMSNAPFFENSVIPSLGNSNLSRIADVSHADQVSKIEKRAAIGSVRTAKH